MPSTFGNDLQLGTTVSVNGALTLARDLRSTHLHVVGNTGSGKSRFLEGLIRQDILQHRRSGCGMLVIDPHGALYDNLISWMAFHRLDRPLIPVDLRTDDWVVSYNMLRRRQDAAPSVIVDAIVDAVAHVWGASNTDATPRLERWLGNIARVLYEKGYTLVEAVHLIGSDLELRAAMTAGITDAMTRRDWKLAEKMKPREFEDEVSSTVSRLRRFVTSERMRLMFGSPAASLDMRTAIEDGSIVLVSLALEGGKVSESNADLFATLLMNDLWIAARERGKRENMRPFYVYVDEFQRFITPTIAENLDEARGFGLHLTLAHQFPNQLRNAGEVGRRVYDSIMENARSKVVFSLSTKDNLQPMAEWLFTGAMNPDEIKHELYSTKVMGYVEELRTTSTRGTTRSMGGTSHSSEGASIGEGGTSSFDVRQRPVGESTSKSESESSSSGKTDSWSVSETESETVSSMLVPTIGKELSAIQYRSMDEQLHRAMAVLFDQEQRQFVTRLRGMRTPVTVTTPFIEAPCLPKTAITEYLSKRYAALPFAVPSDQARRLLDQRDGAFPIEVMRAALDLTQAVIEPTTYKRRLPKKEV